MVQDRTPDFYWRFAIDEPPECTFVFERNTLAAIKSKNNAMSDQPTINFYSVNDEYGEFSNFAAFPIKLKGKHWPTSEHYFQAQKFLDIGRKGLAA